MTGAGAARLRVDDSRAAVGERRGSVTLPGGTAHTCWFRAEGPLGTENGADPFLPVALACAMQAGVPLHVEGPASRALLAGLTEWQAAWCRWRPDRYARVEVTADEVADGVLRGEAGVVAFSGGLDATYTLWRHATGRAGWQQVDVRAAVLVHGFDIALSEAETFARARDRAARITADLGLDLLTVTTNVRSLPIDWEDTHALCIAGVLTALSPRYGIGLIGSGEPYERLPIPWGSSPITDHLLSSRTMSIRHDGAGVGRTEKVAALGSWGEGLAHLRVCWQGDRLDRNCGVCEKCRRTRLNVALAGVERPPGFFETEPAPTRWPAVALHTAPQFAEWEALGAEARSAGRPDVLREVQAVLRWSRVRRVLAGNDALRASVRRLRNLRGRASGRRRPGS